MKQAAIVIPDSMGRIKLGKISPKITGFKMTRSPKTGNITLKPLTPKIEPEAERWLRENPVAYKRILRGIEQSKRGEVFYLGDFSKYANGDEDAI
jgi:hypothetical protein